MKTAFKATLSLAVCFTVSSIAPAIAADQSQMMTSCNTYAAKRLGVSTSEITELSYEGQRVDGTHAVNGATSTGQSFQCSFNSSGSRISQWYHSAPQGCPFDVSEADRYLYPDCN